ncbi:nitrite reductase [Mycobacterium sp. MS1601]|uniref:nitrite reductase n=1 Tax=Mycobacterium sp. MS1601 TaxID=1936029 RepID=UPI0009793D3C|nr:nitrite reductase [Mycobacterium sp. MS1601]AQA01507.1 nitrite reductase [Mycobacterium sp. MS1601]
MTTDTCRLTGGNRSRTDQCPGAYRPWQAQDGLLVRLRLVGGQLPTVALRRLIKVSITHADGDVHLTSRANLQLRGLRGHDGHEDQLCPTAVSALQSTGLLPSATHELVRNILISPQSGHSGGRADLRPVAASLDAALLADDALGRLPGRFLFTLDDGRGDLMDRLIDAGGRGTDLGLVALDDRLVQLRVGDHWGEVVALDEAALHLAGLAAAFLRVRGGGADAPWHLRELPAALSAPVAPDRRIPAPTTALPYGPVGGGTHVHVPDGVLTPQRAETILDLTPAGVPDVVVTPWHGILVPHALEGTDEQL